ncbi:unnamed protein product [Schistosoma mattheei]|uniref:Leucine carboxyl methyltransferase 1 n=1 Tax=Schistosoma mattheei TaxID=31246 RepID=A0AA85BAW5_9TREM|nr:unnamed protein product [Schistosoma mattheei]
MSSPTDEIIQLTNDDATSSKAHAISRGYWKDKYIRYFCSSPSHKTPEINRGYFIRTTAFRAIAISFIKSTGGACQIVNLGAGSDTLYFALKDAQETPELYVEVDLASNIQQKAMTIQRRRLLESTNASPLKDDNLNLTINQKTSVVDALHDNLHYVFETGRFHLLSFDLRRSVQDLLDVLCSTVNGLVASCQLIKGLSVNFPRASFLHYEQVNMSDSFGSIMIKNFRARSCELPGLNACHSLATQEERFFKAVYKMLPSSTRYRVEHLELLDDLEVTMQLFDHYCILLATNDEIICPDEQLKESLATIE